MERMKLSSDLERFREQILASRDPNKPCVALCSGVGCHACASEEVGVAFTEEIEKQGLQNEVELKRTACHGFCAKGPLVVIYPQEICYLQVKPSDIPEVISQTIIEKKIIDRLLYTDPDTGEKVVHQGDIPFYKVQMRLLTGNNSKLEPKNIDDYIALGGYTALTKVLFEVTPAQVVETIKKSGLRGRGGAGFPTGIKWGFCRDAPGEIKYVIVNGHEGDPGAFMDRAILQGNPHSVLEGLIIGAYAIGSHEGYVCIRHDFPLAVENIAIAIEQAKEYGFLGENILDSGFDFDCDLHIGSEPYVCGEETAVISSLEGRPGEPGPRPPYPAVSGLWGKPTNVNNVETWANIPLIITGGADWYSGIGTERSKGTKIISLAGNVNNGGLVEVPMGITLKEIVYNIGGGVLGGKKLKAVWIGGPTGGAVPEPLLRLPVDFDELTKIGAMMGSGGMIVVDEDTCMVDLVKYLLDFLRRESCGKCIPCGEGINRMHEILTDITEGRGREGNIELLEELSEVVRDTSLCALGGTAPNPVFSTLRYFREEYEAHIKEKRCPVGVCEALVPVPAPTVSPIRRRFFRRR